MVHYVSINTVLNVSKNYHFISPPTNAQGPSPYADVMYLWIVPYSSANALQTAPHKIGFDKELILKSTYFGSNQFDFSSMFWQ